eukprot:gene24069-9645_t
MAWWGLKGSDVDKDDDEESPGRKVGATLCRELSSCSMSSLPSQASFYNAKGLITRKALWLDRDDCEFYSEGYSDALRDHDIVQHLKELHVVFIVNYIREVPLWSLKFANPTKSSEGYCVLDYHSVVIQMRAHEKVAETQIASGTATYCWDLDSTMAFPTRLLSYADHALRVKAVEGFASRLQRVYRFIPAAKYVEHFCSNRNHHPRKMDGAWSHVPPPVCDPIKSRDPSVLSNIHRYIVPDAASTTPPDPEGIFGELLSEEEFLKRFNVHI